MIKKFFTSCLIIVSFSNILTAIDIGVYLAPKFLFEIEDSGIKKQNSSKKNIQNLYVGGGIALGYNFDIFHKYSTVRVEFEYLYRNPIPENVYINKVQSMQSHSFLIGAYYDYYFWYTDYDNEYSARSKINNGKRPLMSVYAGILMGGALNTYILNTVYEYGGIFKTSTYYNKGQFLYGFGIGLGFHITPLLSLDLGYRLLLSEKTQYNNDITASLRFNF